MGDLSAHFDSSEFRCRHCGDLELAGELVTLLERLRSIINRPIVIVSGYRCATHNAKVGGASQSQHLFGRAADIRTGVATVRQAREAGFRGIGERRGWAVHVDVRPGQPVTFPD